MSKFQVPTIGGIRKVIRPGGETTSALTTITAVLQQLINAVASLQTPPNTGGGNIGTGNEASIALGPGLAGGGILVGTVPIRLTAPPALIAEDGIDGDPGLQGIQGLRGVQGVQGIPGWFGEDGADGDIGIGLPGATGLQGIQGIRGVQGLPGQNWFGEDGADGDIGIGLPGIQGTNGTNGTNGPQGVPGGVWFAEDQGIDELMSPAPSSVGFLAINNNATITGGIQFPLVVKSNIIAGGIQAVGPSPVLSVLDTAGNASFFVLQAASTGWNLNFGWNSSAPSGNAAFQINGVGALVIVQSAGLTAGVVIKTPNAPGSTGLIVSGSTTGSPIIINGGAGTSVLTMTSSGTATFASNIAIKGITPTVVAGTTALGITTTATVITTSGGIALPALASTFWVVNVNGVAYGVPCFAL